MCQAPKNAALAYQAFGRDVAKMKIDYNRQMLHESWCAIVTDAKNSLAFETYSQGRIATPDGWVTVIQIGFKHDGLTDMRYVAAGYIKGDCPRYQYNPARALDDQQTPRSPYLPSTPPGGYKVPDIGIGAP
jgi:hypothetical protein